MLSFSSRTLLVVLVAASLLLAAPTASLRARQDDDTEPITYYRTGIDPVVTVDPQAAGNTPDIAIAENLFVGLTDEHPLTGEIVPELATHWEVSDDGRVWTFYLRSDVPWVRWDPVTQTSQVLRMVTADDVVLGIQRLCDPRLDTYSVSAEQLIQGCDKAKQTNPTIFTDADYVLVEVYALDDTTVAIHLQHPAGYFLTMSAMWVFHPAPRDVIQAHGPDWTAPGVIATNGAFMLDRWTPDLRLDIVRSPHLPADLRGPGNVERVVSTWVRHMSEVFALYTDSQIETAPVAPDIREEVINDPRYTDQRIMEYGPCVHYFGFTFDKGPFDNAHVRRAFSAALDRQGFIDTFIQGGIFGPALPIIHFTPPGMFGAPPIDVPGVGTDPTYAREQLALGGYPGCEGFPDIEIWTWERVSLWGEYLVSNADTVLGCNPDRLHVTAVPDQSMVSTLNSDLPPEDRPHMFTAAWCPDFNDAHSFVGYVPHCEGMNPFRRPCNEIDDLIDQAARESDPLTRTDLYRDIEERFFGPEGEHPLLPMFLAGGLALHQPWIDGPWLTQQTAHFDWYTIDQEMQLAARGG